MQSDLHGGTNKKRKEETMYLSEYLLIANNAKMHSEEARAVGDSFIFPEPKRAMYKIADDYEKQANAFFQMALMAR